MANILNLSCIEQVHLLKMKEEIENCLPNHIYNINNKVRLLLGKFEYVGEIVQLNGDGSYDIEHSGHIIQRDVHVKDIKVYHNYGECTICFDDIIGGRHDIAFLDCKHIYHYNCLLKWYSNPNANYSCPLCNVQRDITNVYPEDKFQIKRAVSKKRAKCSIL